MRRVFMLITCLGASVLLLYSWGRSQDPGAPGGPPPAPLPAPPVRDLSRIAERPYEEVQAIVRRHQDELMKVPGVYEVGEKGILVGVFVHTNAQGERSLPRCPPRSKGSRWRCARSTSCHCLPG